MKSVVVLVLILALATLLTLSVTPKAACALDCDDLPLGWWNHPGLYGACLLMQYFWHCGFYGCDDEGDDYYG